MKGKQICSLGISCLLLLSGCSSTVQEDGKDVVASIDGHNILADDIYTNISSTYSGQMSLFNYVLDQLIQENFPINNDMKDEAKKSIENIKSNYQNQYGSSYEEQLEEDLAAEGYDDLEAYEKSLVDILQYSEFMKKYVKEHFDEVFDRYYEQEKPRIMSLIKISVADMENISDEEKEKIDEIEKLLKTDKSFGDIAQSYSDDKSSSAKGNIGIVDSTLQLGDTYGEDVEKKALSLKEGEVSSMIKGKDGYYVLYCQSQDKETIKDELKTVDISSPLISYDNYMVYDAFKSYKLEYKNEDIKKAIDTIINDALEKRNEGSEGA